MPIEIFLRDETQKLVRAGVETARLDVLILLEDVLNTDRAQLLAHQELELTAEQVQTLDARLARRARHEPLAYIRGVVEFYGREFVVSPAVLVPRPESETMIDLLLKLVREDSTLGFRSPQNGLDSNFHWNDNRENGPSNTADFDKSPKNITVSGQKSLTSKALSGLTIGDVGAGSGVLGITAALELPGSRVELLEIDETALQVARLNTTQYRPEILVTRSDLLTAASLDFDILLCNLPYVPDDFAINQAAMAEPKLALFGGADGLDLFRSLFVQIDTKTVKPRLILTESLPDQHADLAAIATRSGYHQTAAEDFIQAFELET